MMTTGTAAVNSNNATEIVQMDATKRQKTGDESSDKKVNPEAGSKKPASPQHMTAVLPDKAPPQVVANEQQVLMVGMAHTRVAVPVSADTATTENK